MVEVRFNVIDDVGRVVTGISKDAFTLFEDGQKRDIEYFSDEKAPVTIAIVFAISDSITSEVFDSLRRAFTELLKHRKPVQDDFIIIEAGARTKRTLSDYGLGTLTGKQAPDSIIKTNLDVIDSCSFAIDSITKRSATSNPILLLLTDNLDSKLPGVSTELYQKLRESNVTFYALGITGKNNLVAASKNDNHPLVMLAELAFLSGGDSQFTERESEITDYLVRFGLTLDHMYTLRFNALSIKQKGELYRINIKVHLPIIPSHLMVRNREGLIWVRKR